MNVKLTFNTWWFDMQLKVNLTLFSIKRLNNILVNNAKYEIKFWYLDNFRTVTVQCTKLTTTKRFINTFELNDIIVHAYWAYPKNFSCSMGEYGTIFDPNANIQKVKLYKNMNHIWQHCSWCINYIKYSLGLLFYYATSYIQFQNILIENVNSFV